MFVSHQQKIVFKTCEARFDRFLRFAKHVFQVVFLTEAFEVYNVSKKQNYRFKARSSARRESRRVFLGILGSGQTETIA